ncbi:MAG: YlmC/YmxH family sporulation protein [Dethiobacteria bacterium]|nr:YlmC/YmxH family sporulation protein [Bacillota bacterium]HPT33566.1 YlmC/YmxH family sporulation protein [Bacillota bacterium]
MRLSELSRKELVDINEGAFWGPAGKADLVIDEESGAIASLILGGSPGILGIGYSEETVIPWSALIKIGKDVIIFKLPES